MAADNASVHVAEAVGSCALLGEKIPLNKSFPSKDATALFVPSVTEEAICFDGAMAVVSVI